MYINIVGYLHKAAIDQPSGRITNRAIYFPIDNLNYLNQYNRIRFGFYYITVWGIIREDIGRLDKYYIHWSRARISNVQESVTRRAGNDGQGWPVKPIGADGNFRFVNIMNAVIFLMYIFKIFIRCYTAGIRWNEILYRL
jgi:hypothetical protein